MDVSYIHIFRTIWIIKDFTIYTVEIISKRICRRGNAASLFYQTIDCHYWCVQFMVSNDCLSAVQPTNQTFAKKKFINFERRGKKIFSLLNEMVGMTFVVTPCHWTLIKTFFDSYVVVPLFWFLWLMILVKFIWNTANAAFSFTSCYSEAEMAIYDRCVRSWP